MTGSVPDAAAVLEIPDPMAPEAVAPAATLVEEPTIVAVSELATTVDGTLIGTGMNCGTPTGTGMAIFLTFLTWWWWWRRRRSFLLSSVVSCTVGVSLSTRSPRSAGAFGTSSEPTTHRLSATKVAKAAADFMREAESIGTLVVAKWLAAFELVNGFGGWHHCASAVTLHCHLSITTRQSDKC